MISALICLQEFLKYSLDVHQEFQKKFLKRFILQLVHGFPKIKFSWGFPSDSLGNYFKYCYVSLCMYVLEQTEGRSIQNIIKTSFQIFFSRILPEISKTHLLGITSIFGDFFHKDEMFFQKFRYDFPLEIQKLFKELFQKLLLGFLQKFVQGLLHVIEDSLRHLS